MKKINPKILTLWLRNIIALSFFLLLRILYIKRKNDGKNLLFVQLGYTGDLIISSLIFSNELIFEEQIFFLIDKSYSNILTDYNGKIKIIKISVSLYKWFFPYRLYVITRLRRNSFKRTINLTHNRPTISDELSLFNGSEEIYALSEETHNLIKVHKKLINRYYDKILYDGTINEYDKIISLLKNLKGKLISTKTICFIRDKTRLNVMQILLNKFGIHEYENFITIAPFSSNKNKDWPMKSYIELLHYISNEVKLKALLLGNLKQKKRIDAIIKFQKQNLVFNLAGIFTIVESAAIVQRSSIFIGNDSALLHIAKAVKVPTIGIIGGGSFDIFHPYMSTHSDKLLYHTMDCFGCEWKCIYEEPFCLTKVTVGNVFKNIHSWGKQVSK